MSDLSQEREPKKEVKDINRNEKRFFRERNYKNEELYVWKIGIILVI
jgi:hypothetical protein